MSPFWKIFFLMLMLLNPFLIVVYLTDIMRKSTNSTFRNLMITAGLISITVFSIFALIGEFLFENIMQTEIASFQIFGGIVFLVIALKFMFSGESAISNLRAESKHVSSSIAMPILVGPGTIGVSILAGKQLPILNALIAIILSVSVSIVIIIILKKTFDSLTRQREDLIEQYIEISGKITALVVGTYSIDMIMKGLAAWVDKIS